MPDILSSSLSRRSLLRIMGGSFLSLLGLSWLKPSQASASGDLGLIRQQVANDLGTGRIIMWQASNLSDRVRVQLKGPDGHHEFIPAYNIANDETSLPFIHYAKLDGLIPGQVYSYRIFSDAIATDWFPLQTLSADGSFSALLFSDNQSTDAYKGFRRLLLQALLRHNTTDLLLLTGDIVDCGAASYYWRQFFSALDGVAEHLPLVPVIGNHECYNENWQYCLPEDYLARFVPPPNGSRNWPGHYYSFDCGCVHFAVLDTQWEEEHNWGSGLFTEQAAWLRRDMAGTNKKWHIVIMHRDIINYEAVRAHHYDGNAAFSLTGHTFMPVFDELKIDAVLTGHLHIYRRRRLRNFAHSEKGTLYLCCGVSGNVRGYHEPLSIYDDVHEPNPNEASYLQLNAAPHALTFRACRPDGTEFDRFVLQK